MNDWSANLTKAPLVGMRYLLPLGVAMLGVWGPLSAEEAGGDAPAAEAPPATETAPATDETPPEADTRTPAEKALDAYAQEADLLKMGKKAKARYHYEQGMAFIQKGYMDAAIRELDLATTFEPSNEEYRKALSTARTMAGKEISPYNTNVGDLADRLNAQHLQLWVEIEQYIENGKKHLLKGEYNAAEFAFDTAKVRLQSLPYADVRKEPKLREVERLIAEARQRRSAYELDRATGARELSAIRERERRLYELKLEKDRINQMLARALKARDRRAYDECILLCEQIMRINRADPRAHELLVRSRRERHVYLRQITADKWDEEHKLLSEQIRSAMLPQLEIVSYSEDWQEINSRRSAPTQVNIEEEAAWRTDIEQKLEQKLTLDFPELGIDEVVRFLQRNTDVNFVLDPQVAAGDIPPITMKLKEVKLRNALEFIMLNTGLKYSLQGEAVFISDEDGLRGDVYMKVYDIRDLTLGITDFPGPKLEIPEPGGTGAQLIPEIADESPAEIGDFMEIIEEIIPQEHWDVDGTGLDEWNGSLVVTQTGNVHDQIAELLRTLRNQQAVQINVKVRFLSVENTLLEEIGFDWNNFRGPVGWPAPISAGPNPFTPQVTPPYWLGGYWADDAVNPRNIYGGQITNELGDYITGSELTNSGGLFTELQIYEDPEGFLGRVVLRAVEKDRRSNVLIAPDITMMSGQRAHLVRMNQQAYIADYDVVGDQYDPIVTVISYGTVLDVEAVASADRRYITLTLRPTTTEITAWRRFGTDLEDFAGRPVINTDSDGNNLGAVASLFPLLVPEVSYRSVQTSVTIPDGGSLLIAGMTLGHSARAHAGIPVLSHIPFLGRLFSKNGRTEREYKDLIYVEGNIILFDEIEAKL